MSLRSLPAVQAFRHDEQLVFEPDYAAEDKFTPTLRAANDDADNSISLYGPIGRDPWGETDNTERRVSAALRKIGNQEVVVNINSPGGDLISGLAIYNLLRAHPAKITVNVIALAGSAASVIAMAGDEIHMAMGSFIMLHRASVCVCGNRYEMLKANDLLSEMDDAMATIYAARSGKDHKAALAWMDKSQGEGTMFNVKSALEAGLADGELDPGAIKNGTKASKTVPTERIIEKALMSYGHSSSQAKTLVAQFKSGTRDAADHVTRDAGELMAAMERLKTTMSGKG